MTATEDGIDERPLLLIVGTPAAGSHALRERLVAESASTGGPAADPESTELTLDNKYYTARVQVGLAAPDLSASPATIQEHEAQILVFAASSEASFDAVRSWAHFSGSTEGGEHEPEIKLCVATMAEALPRDGDAEVQRPPWLVTSRQWASDNYYEYVEVSSASNDANATRSPDGDLQGVARILEALQAHQWPGLVRKTPPAVGRALHTADAQQRRSQPSDERGDSTSALEPTQDTTAAAHVPADDGPLEGSNVLAFREFLSSGDAAAGLSPLDADDESEQRFDQLMAAFAGCRERLQQLPDSQRRKAAETMAMQMMEAFGLDDTDESDSSGDETSNQMPRVHAAAVNGRTSDRRDHFNDP